MPHPPFKASGRQDPCKHWVRCSFQGVRKASARVFKVSGICLTEVRKEREETRNAERRQ